MSRVDTKPGFGSQGEQPTDVPSATRVIPADAVISEDVRESARYTTDPRLERAAPVERDLIRGLVPSAEDGRAGLPAIDAMSSAARAEAKILRLAKERAAGAQSLKPGAVAPSPSLDTPSDRRSSTTVTRKVASWRYARFSLVVLALGMLALCLLYAWLRPTAPVVAPNVPPSAMVPTAPEHQITPSVPVLVPSVSPETPVPSATVNVEPAASVVRPPSATAKPTGPHVTAIGPGASGAPTALPVPAPPSPSPKPSTAPLTPTAPSTATNPEIPPFTF